MHLLLTPGQTKIRLSFFSSWQCDSQIECAQAIFLSNSLFVGSRTLIFSLRSPQPFWDPKTQTIEQQKAISPRPETRRRSALSEGALYPSIDCGTRRLD